MKKVLLIISSLIFISVVVVFLVFSHYKEKYITGENADTNFQTDMGKAFDKITDNKFDDEILSNENAVCKYLVDYVTAQKEYKLKNDSYTTDLSRLNLPEGMIAAQMTNIGGEGFQDGFNGYHFAHVKMNGTTQMNYNKDFVLCAVPVLYRVTGINSFAIGPKSIVLFKDTTGMPVHNATEFGTGWKINE